MYMSLAVADLRQSVADTVASGASVYQSAMSERVIEEEPEGRDGSSASDNRSNSTGSPRTSVRGRSRSRSATPTGHPRPPSEVLLLTFGSEDIVMRLKTTRPSGPYAAAPQSPPTDSHPSQSPSRSTFPANTGSQLPALDIELSMGTIAALICPDQAATILCALQAATRPPSETSPGSPTPDSAGSNVLWYTTCARQTPSGSRQPLRNFGRNQARRTSPLGTSSCALRAWIAATRPRAMCHVRAPRVDLNPTRYPPPPGGHRMPPTSDHVLR
jgi:hypothetical protein